MKILYYDDEKLEKIETAHLDSLVNLVKEVWDKSATVENYLSARASQFVSNPYMKENGAPVALLIDNNKVVGQCNSTPCKLWNGKQELIMFWNSGLHLSNECRGKGLGLALPQKMTERLPIVTGFFVVPQQLRTHQKLGYHIIGKIPDFMKLYKPYRFFLNINLDVIEQIPDLAKKIIQWNNNVIRIPLACCFAAAIKFYQLVRKITNSRGDNKRISFSFVDDFDSRIDQLWDMVKPSIHYAQVRNSAYMNWQFKADKGWKKIIMKENDKVLGFALVAVRKNKTNDKFANMKIVSTIDLLWDFSRDDILNQYFEFIDTYAKYQDADMAFCSINHLTAKKQLKFSGYINIPDSVYFVVRSQRPEIKLSGRKEDWFFTRGDADAAGSLGPSPL